MRNKFVCLTIIVSLITLWNVKTVRAQVNTESNSGYISLKSYDGSTTPNVFTFQIHVRGSGIHYPNWSLLVRANQPISNSEGKFFDPSKISIRINSITGGPTFQSIGTTNKALPLSFNDQALFQKSKYAIVSTPNNYAQYIFTFDIIIAAGSYLEALKTFSEYNLSLTFTILAANDNPISESSSIVRMQIYPTDTPPGVSTYSIQVNSSARNGLVEFKTLSDYVNGVSQTYQNGLSITSNTPYAVQVKSLAANLESNNNTLPVNAISLAIKDPNNSAIGGTVILSENAQTVFNATNIGSKARLFDLRYFTKANDERMLNAKPANYQTTLMYTLIPQ